MQKILYCIILLFFLFFFSDEKKSDEYKKLDKELKEKETKWQVRESDYEEKLTLVKQEKNEFYNKIRTLLAKEEVCGSCFFQYLFITASYMARISGAFYIFSIQEINTSFVGFSFFIKGYFYSF